MRYFVIFLLLLFALPAAVRPQGPPNVTPTPDPVLMRQIEWQRIRRSMDNLDRLGKTTYPTAKPSAKPTEDNKRIILDALYRRSRNDELQLMAPDEEDQTKYADFLKQSESGLTKLVRDFGCDEFSTVPRNERICQRFSMPGGGSAFSFRESDYQLWKLADLLYDGKSFIAFGQMSLGFIVDLGDQPLEIVRLDSKGLAYLTGFAPSGNISEATKQNTSLADGFADSGFLYKKFLPIVVDHTYVVRSVAYKGKVEREHYGAKYNELDFDKREDVIVAFRAVRQDFNGTATILWKILQTKQSPVLDPNK
jgi:hypothetical protein